MHLLEGLAVHCQLDVIIIPQQPEPAGEAHGIYLEGAREAKRCHDLLSSLATHTCFRYEDDVWLVFVNKLSEG